MRRAAVLTQDAQARVYEVLQGIWNYLGTGTCDVENGSGDDDVPFRPQRLHRASDSRIPPLGFTPATRGRSERIRPASGRRDAYPETSPGSGVLVNYDTATYTLAGAGRHRDAADRDGAALLPDREQRLHRSSCATKRSTTGFQDENDMCSGGPDRPFTVGPQSRTRGEYVYELWNNAADDTTQPGYGKSPPELMQTSAATTSTR